MKTAANWELVAEHAGWAPRDSMGGIVFRDRMWILGGWFGSHVPCPRDVWSSPDGKTWRKAAREAPWKHSDFPVVLERDGSLWVMGGWFNGRLPGCCAGNEVWSSRDGRRWRRETGCAGWSARVGAAGVVFSGRMWILGGVQHYFGGNEGDLRNDVWSSEDGIHWELALRNAPWNPRAFHQAIVFQNKIWVLGGGNYLPSYAAWNDVWCSDDGARWTRVTAGSPWHPRLWFSTAVYRDRLWVLGGWSKEPFRDWNDVWHSADGKEWERLETRQVWAGRHAQACFVFDDALWIAGGLVRPLSNEVWRLRLPASFAQTGAPTPPNSGKPR